MALKLTPNLTLISNGDADTNWSSDIAAKDWGTDDEFYKEGGASITGIANDAGAGQESLNYLTYTPPTNLNLVNKHLFFVWNTAQSPLMWSNYSGIRFEINDGANTGRWDVAGKDTYDGGWVWQVISVDRDFDLGTCDRTNIDTLTWNLNLYAASKKAAYNIWFDILRYGTGVTVQGGTSTDPGTFNDIYTSSQSSGNAYGVIDYYGGVYYPQAEFYFGDNTTTSYFKDGGETIVFKDQYVSGGLYKIIVSGSKAVFQLGEKAGTAGVDGCVITQEPLLKTNENWSFDAVTYSISGVRIYGCTIGKAVEFKLPPYYSDGRNDCRNTTFSECGMLEPSSCTFQDNNIISAPDIGVLMEPGHHITDTAIISCPSGILISSAGGVYTFDNITFTDVNQHIVNMTGTWVSASATNGANPSTYVNIGTSTTKISNDVDVIVYTYDEDSDIISGAVVAIYSGTTSAALDNKQAVAGFPLETDTDGKAQGALNYADWNVDLPITVRVRKSTPGTGNRYYPLKSTGTIYSTGYTLTATLIEDPIVT